jgi:hypothetical protein
MLSFGDGKYDYLGEFYKIIFNASLFHVYAVSPMQLAHRVDGCVTLATLARVLSLVSLCIPPRHGSALPDHPQVLLCVRCFTVSTPY